MINTPTKCYDYITLCLYYVIDSIYIYIYIPIFYVDVKNAFIIEFKGYCYVSSMVLLQ